MKNRLLSLSAVFVVAIAAMTGCGVSPAISGVMRFRRVLILR